jgi:hypothetical protein
MTVRGVITWRTVFFPQLKDVGDHFLLIGFDFAGFPAQAGDGFQFLRRDQVGLVAVGHHPGHQLGEDDQRFEDHDHDVEGHNDVRPQLSGKGDPDGLGQDLGEQEDGEGEGEGKPHQTILAEQGDSGGAGHRGADGVGQGVEGEDGGDRLFDVFLEFSHPLGLPGMGFAQQLHLWRGQAQEDRLEERTSGGHQQGTAHGENKDNQHGKPPQGHDVFPGCLPTEVLPIEVQPGLVYENPTINSSHRF